MNAGFSFLIQFSLTNQAYKVLTDRTTSEKATIDIIPTYFTTAGLALQFSNAQKDIP